MSIQKRICETLHKILMISTTCGGSEIDLQMLGLHNCLNFGDSGPERSVRGLNQCLLLLCNILTSNFRSLYDTDIFANLSRGESYCRADSSLHIWRSAWERSVGYLASTSLAICFTKYWTNIRQSEIGTDSSQSVCFAKAMKMPAFLVTTIPHQIGSPWSITTSINDR